MFIQNRMNGCDCWGPDGRLDTKIDQIDLCHISMSYASFVIIWHFMSYDAYDIKIWHQSIWSILVSKRPSGPQQSHPLIRFWLTNCLKIKKLKKYVSEIFPFINFENPLYFEDRKGGVGGSTFQYPSDLKFMFLDTYGIENGIRGNC